MASRETRRVSTASWKLRLLNLWTILSLQYLTTSLLTAVTVWRYIATKISHSWAMLSAMLFAMLSALFSCHVFWQKNLMQHCTSNAIILVARWLSTQNRCLSNLLSSLKAFSRLCRSTFRSPFRKNSLALSPADLWYVSLSCLDFLALKPFNQSGHTYFYLVSEYGLRFQIIFWKSMRGL